MKYRVTCLTPTLVGDGQKLAPIDYMVWKDHVNVLDQRRIFRLLAKGPRLDGYLSQLKKAEKLDFASWGGFAQNYAGRRIPFEHPSCAQHWERTRAENLFIPTFSTGPSGPYLPGTAVKGALRTGVVHGRITEKSLEDLSQRAASEGRLPRNPGRSIEENAIGAGGADAMRLIAAADSKTVPETSFKIYLLRTSTLETRGGGKFELAWKQAPRGNVKRLEDSTPTFAEMAVPGTVFEGEWHENPFARKKRGATDAAAMFELANGYAERLLQLQRQYAEWTGMAGLRSTIDQLAARLAEIRQFSRGCLLALGWSAGFLSKVSYLNTEDEASRQILRQVGLYTKAIQSGMPFPKTRRIVFLGNQPAALAGFVHLEVG